MREHKRKAHDKREFCCEQCNVNVIGYNSLQTHLRVHEKVKCAECNNEIKRNGPPGEYCQGP